MASRLMAALAALGSLGSLFLASRPVQAAPAELPPAELPPEIPPAELPRVTSGRLSPGDVLAYAREADPEGWMPAAELLAFVQVESSFRTNAIRWEPRLGEASYGLMQVLESTARDRGLVGDPRAMFEPVTGLRMGILQARWSWEFLRRKLGRDPTEAEWVGSYNAGVGNILRGWFPQGYIRNWQLARDRWAVGA